MKTKKNNKLLTIIIPAFNAQKTLSKCINSIIDQKKNWVELIVINDNSEDKTLEICKKYKKKIGKDNFKFFSLKKNRGPGFCRNIGIKNSSGIFLAFLDSDDFFLKNSLVLLKEIILKKNPDILINNNMRNKKPFSNDFFFNNFNYSVYKKKEFLKTFSSKKLNINECWKIVVKKKVINKNKILFPPVYVGEDQCFVFETILNSKNIFINKKPIIYHYSSLSGLSSSNLLDMTLSFIFLLDYFYKIKRNNVHENLFINEKIKYLETILYINFLNFKNIQITKIFKKFYSKFKTKNLNHSKKTLYKKIMTNNFKFIYKIDKFINKNKNVYFYIFSNNFLGKSLKNYLKYKGIKIKYVFDDNTKFNLIGLEKYKFKKNLKNHFFIAVADLQIYRKIKKKIDNLKLNNSRILKFV